MTDEFGLNGSIECESRLKAMNGDSTQSRIARYKEERRKQLAGQFANLSHNGNDTSSSSSSVDGSLKKTSFRPLNSNLIKDDDVRKPKISNNYKNPNKFRYKQNIPEESTDSKSKSNGSITPDSTATTSSKSNRDKSAKRKSNLNRSTNVEKVPNSHNRHQNYHSADEGSEKRSAKMSVSSTLPSNAANASPASSSSVSSQKTSPSPNYRKSTVPVNCSQISSHSVSNGFAQCYEAENADRNAVTVKSSVKDGLPVFEHRTKASDKEMLDKSKIPRRIVSPSRFSPRCHNYAQLDDSSVDTTCDNTSSEFRLQHVESIVLENENTNCSDICSLDSLNGHYSSFGDYEIRDHLNERTMSPKEEVFVQKNPLLEIIQNFSDKNAQYDTPTAELDLRRNSTKHYSSPPQNTSLEIIEEDITHKPSILKKKFDERSNSLDLPRFSSILKRKTIEDVGHNFQNVRSYRQGILKKHSSLDEDEVRRRSCSPDVDIGRHHEFKPILKSQRRSSLEELVRNRSPELHSILKRSKTGNDDSDSGSSPHGILKRKVSIMNGNSYSPDSLEMCGKEWYDDVKPILKNKQNSFDTATSEKFNFDTPRPILKKKQSFETDGEDDKPMKPILKSSRRSLDEETESFLARESFSGHVKHGSWNASENLSIKPILKKKNSLLRDSRSVKSDDDAYYKEQSNVKRHSLPVTSSLSSITARNTEENGISVAERVLNLENIHVEENQVEIDDFILTASSSRNLRFSRNVERYKTQPITHQEIFSTKSAMEDRRNENPVAKEPEPSVDQPDNMHKHIEVTEEKNELDDKAVISHLKRSNSVSMKASLFSKWQNEGKKATEELKSRKKDDKTAGGRKLKIKCSDLASRFSTQPITWEEVAEAKKQNQERSKVQDVIRKEILQNVPENEEDRNDPSLMPLSERVKLFTQKMEQPKNKPIPKYPKRLNPRFNTQPVTTEEVQIAKNAASRKIGNDSVVQKEEENRKKIADIINHGVPKPKESTSRKESQSDSGTASLENVNDDKDLDFQLDDEFSGDNIEKLFEKIYMENSSETGSQSEGDTSSSGGREIQQIIGCKQTYVERREKRSGVTEMNIGAVMSGATDVVDDCPVINGNSSIAQRLAALQRSGQLDWKKRISRIAPENELSPVININETQELLKKELTNGFRCKITSETYHEEKKDSSLAERLEKLESASQTWKKRIEPSDAVQFSVAGKMASTLSAVALPMPVTSPLAERKKRAPCPSRFRSFREKKEVRSTPISPEKSATSVSVFARSNSLPSEVNDSDEAKEIKSDENSVVSVPQIFDEDFSTFFGSSDFLGSSTEAIEFNTDFNDIKIETPRLVSTHKKIRAHRKHATSGNPLKTLSTRIEIKNEYREVKTNIAEKEFKRMNVEKLSKNSSLAVEVLAGLASKEDFSAVHLKKAGAAVSAPLLPYKSLMLLHIKGRRHVQTRLVEPVVPSVNSGDSFVLVTPNEVYHWIGQFCNVIEKSRGAEIAQHILTTHDLGCGLASHVNTIIEDVSKSNPKAAQNFWKLLGASPEEAVSIKAARSGHPDEDEIYESSLISTNMIFEVVEDELVPLEKYWASVPKIQMLDPNKVLVFDFGSELYIWMGKNVDLKQRKSSVKLAKELWDSGYNYEECDLCPVTSAFTIGDREVDESHTSKISKERPEWCLIAKVTQHMETVLFREKFLDWPDFSRVIRAKGKDEDTEKQIDGSLDIKPCDAKEMLDMKLIEPDLVLEGTHLGRGIQYFDEERRKFCTVATLDVRMWHIMEFESEEVPKESLGQFFSTDSYVIRWIYSVSYTGRELSGQPSKHTVTGRDRCVYFCWQGKNASLNEQGAAALLTVELDKEKGMQLRICQGYEPPVFFNLFKGRTAIYRNNSNDKKWKLFICRGEINTEAALLEVSCNIKQLRSRASFVLVNVDTGVLYVWHGCKVTKAASEACSSIVDNLKTNCPPELGLKTDTIVEVTNVKEGSEPKEFFNGLGGSSRKLYLSLLESKEEHNVTPFLYNLSSNSGTFCATPIWSPSRHVEIVTAYPFLQEDLYSASQPALFLLDTGKELWLWQGWWPEHEKILQEESNQSDEIIQNSDNFRGSATVRWQLERRAAMQTALDYWKLKYDNKPLQAFLVWAGLEPVQFTSLFPNWDNRDDVAEMNILDGRKPGEVLDVEQELARLTQSTYPIEQLLQRPLPDGVDPTKLELYLSPAHFKEILNVTKEEFAALPSWKQTNLKKNAGLF